MKKTILGAFLSAALIIAGTTSVNAQVKGSTPAVKKEAKAKQVKAVPVQKATPKASATNKTTPKVSTSKSATPAATSAKTVPMVKPLPKPQAKAKAAPKKALKKVTKESVQAKPIVQPKATGKN